MMPIQCNGAYAYISSWCDFSKGLFVETLLNLSAIRQSPEALQKVCLVALSALRAFNFQYNTNYYSALINVLDAAPAFDFYAGFRLPRYFFYPYCAERIDEHNLLNQLEGVLCQNWQIGEGRDAMRQFAKQELTAFLDDMVNHDDDFSTEEEFKKFLRNWLRVRLKNDLEVKFDPAMIDLSALKIKLKSYSQVDKVMFSGFFFADIACIPDFLQTWGVISLAPCVKAVGSIPLFSWVRSQSLGDWVWLGLLTGFVCQFVDAAQSLWKEELSPAKRREAQWVLVASVAECALCISNLMKASDPLINGLALIAKSLGVKVFFVSAKVVFFAESK